MDQFSTYLGKMNKTEFGKQCDECCIRADRPSDVGVQKEGPILPGGDPGIQL